MENENNTQPSQGCCDTDKGWHKQVPCNGSYGLAFLGAAIYYIQQADTFWMGVLGVLKALVWPAFLAYELFKYLKI